MLDSKVIDQLRWAGYHHDEVKQKYDTFPYYVHLIDVVTFLSQYGFSEELQMAAACHDLLEDTNLSYNDLANVVGKEVADIVYDVTNELGKNRKEKAEKTYPKIAANPKAIVVKVADRIANTRYSKESESGMYAKYCKEFPAFKGNLCTQESMEVYPQLEEMWDVLENLSTINKG